MHKLNMDDSIDITIHLLLLLLNSRMKKKKKSKKSNPSQKYELNNMTIECLFVYNMITHSLLF